VPRARPDESGTTHALQEGVGGGVRDSGILARRAGARLAPFARLDGGATVEALFKRPSQ